MKKLIMIMAIGLCCKTTFAQKELVTVDEHNKYIFYQMVDAPALKADTLYNRFLAGIKSSKHYQKVKLETSVGASVKLQTSTMLYTSMTMAKHEAGELNYTLVTEFKDGKYRYWLTDFVFTSYERNRYGVYAKVSGTWQALELLKTKIDERTLNNYLEQIAKVGKETGQEMTLYLAEPIKKTAEPVKVDTRKW